MDNKIIEKLAQCLHSIWKEEKESEGYHQPGVCPNFEKAEDEEERVINEDLIHCNKCLTSLVEFKLLSDYQKNSYRNTAEKLYEELKKNESEITFR